MVCKKFLSAQAAEIGSARAGQQGSLVFGGVHVQRRTELLAQPMGQAHVVGVHVGDHHSQDRQALHGACKHLAPGLLRAWVGHAAVHCGPAMASALFGFFRIFQQLEVDVVQGKRQGHPDPENTGRNLKRLTERWQGVVQGEGQGFLAG